eukprot:gene17254-17444_t
MSNFAPFRRLGLIWQLLIPSMIATILSVLAVQAWTLNIGQRALEQRMDISLDTNLELMKSYLAPLGNTWSLEGGKMLLGDTNIAERDDIIDHVGAASQGVVTIFNGNTRAVTNVLKPDGSRAVGTQLTDPAVIKAVLQDGATFRGQATILGKHYLTIYQPIRSFEGKIIGILFVGLPTAELEAVEYSIILQGALAGLLVMIVLALVNSWLMRRTLLPLDQLVEVMGKISEGDLDAQIPSVARQDQVGRLACALFGFKTAAVEKLEMEAERRAVRQAREDDRHQAEAVRVIAANELSQVVNELAKGLTNLSDGILTYRIEQPFAREFEELRHDFNQTIDKLNETMVVVTAATITITSSTSAIAQSSSDLSDRTKHTAASLEETAAAITEITATTKNTADRLTHVSEVVSAAARDADRSTIATNSLAADVDELAAIMGHFRVSDHQSVSTGRMQAHVPADASKSQRLRRAS